MLLVVPVVYLAWSGVWRLLESSGPARSTVAPAAISPEVQASGEGGAQPEAVELVGASPVPTDLSETKVTSPEEVREVLRITREATGADRQALVQAALHAEDALVAGNAILALGRLGAFSSSADLLGLLTDSRLRVRQDAAKACGLDGRVEALPYLEQALEARDEMVRPLVIKTLGMIGGDRARELLERAQADPLASKTDRVFARAALKSM